MANGAQVDSYISTKDMLFSDLLLSSPSVHFAAYTYGEYSGWVTNSGTYMWFDSTWESEGTYESGSFGRYEWVTRDLDSLTYLATYVLPVVDTVAGNPCWPPHGVRY